MLSAIELKLMAMLEPALKVMGYELVGCRLLPMGTSSTLQVFIDADGGVTIDDCTAASRQISAILDVEDPIKQHYKLEVSSPGLDRLLFTLAQFEKVVGQCVKVKLQAPQDGRRNFNGRLLGVDDEAIIVQQDNEPVRLLFNEIDKANVEPEFGRK